VARWLEAIVTSLGTPVPGLPGGLTHTFPDAEMVTSTSLGAVGLPTADATAVAALAAAVADGYSALRCGASLDTLAAVPGIDPDLRHHLAFRLGQREAFPLTDPSLNAALADLGLHPSSTNPRPVQCRSSGAHGSPLRRPT
jgi:AraC family transcriptional regulator, regulatory protein of adaptative response / DNA-3-methyladenine glycosylase II